MSSPPLLSSRSKSYANYRHKTAADEKDSQQIARSGSAQNELQEGLSVYYQGFGEGQPEPATLAKSGQEKNAKVLTKRTEKLKDYCGRTCISQALLLRGNITLAYV
jgi:hypothetical protein